MEKISTYPFKILRKRFGLLVIPFLPILFLLVSSLYVSGDYSFNNLLTKTDNYFGGVVYLSTSDLTQYDKIGADGLIPIMRLGAITKGTSIENFNDFYTELSTNGLTERVSYKFIIFLTLFFAFLAYAVISRILYDSKMGEETLGLRGVNLSSIFLSLAASLIIMFISSFSFQGFQLILLLNFAIFFTFSMPHAATGVPVGESLYRAFDFIRFNLGGAVTLYLLSMGAAIAVPVGLMLLFVVPLSAVDISIVPFLKVALLLFGITFAVFYQYIICARESLDFGRPVETRAPALKTRMAKRVR